MFERKDKNELRLTRHARVRTKISGTQLRPRLCVYRSLKHIYAQLVDDDKGVTLVSASTLDAALRESVGGKGKKDAAKLVGKAVAERAVAAGYKSVVFDRGGYVYAGRVAELASGARDAGLTF